MAKVFYEDILVGEILSNHGLTVDEALEMINFKEDEFLQTQGFEEIDYNEFTITY